MAKLALKTLGPQYPEVILKILRQITCHLPILRTATTAGTGHWVLPTRYLLRRYLLRDVAIVENHSILSILTAFTRISFVYGGYGCI